MNRNVFVFQDYLLFKGTSRLTNIAMHFNSLCIHTCV